MLQRPILDPGASQAPGDIASLTAVAEQLRSLTLSQEAKPDGSLASLVEDVLAAAADLEQQLSDQQARIRYLESLSVTDELTGLLNRRGFQIELRRALADARRRGENGLLLLIDLDHFKTINDSYGHVAGDAVLCAVAELLTQRTRKNDHVARLGGDEFAVLMSGIKPERGEALVNKLGRLINGLVVSWRKLEIPVSASLGPEPFGPHSRAEQLLNRADRALYRDKGRCLSSVVKL